MDNQRHRSERPPWQAYDQFVTDSMILSDEFVESALADTQSDTRNPHRASQGILNGLILSLLLWALVLLPFLVFESARKIQSKPSRNVTAVTFPT